MVFWALGAYNRLVRLKTTARVAVTKWQAVLLRWVQLSQGWQASAQARALGSEDGTASAYSERLEHASQVLEAALVAAQSRSGERLPSPPERDTCRALLAAWTDMLADLGGSGDMEVAPWRAQVADLQAVTTIAARNVEDAVQSYRSAIRQFPACVLARACGLGEG